MRNVKGQRLALLLSGISLWAACSSTSDVIGFNRPALTGGDSSTSGGRADGGAPGNGAMPAAGDGGAGTPPERSYPNLFGELLGKTENEITRRLDSDYAQLFHGDPADESVFVPVGADRAYLLDPRQGDVRADGFSNALLISVELDHRDEFDKLWRWAQQHMVATDGALRGYLRSRCETTGVCADTVAVEPHVGATTALWLADGRWGSDGALDYRADALRLMAATFRVEPAASTALGELAGMIEPSHQLPRATPYAVDDTLTRAVVLTPAHFALWAEKTGDARALTLAQRSRELLAKIADTDTGLLPDSASFDGVAAAADGDFSANSYPALEAISLDAVWFETSAWHRDEANRLLGFFRAPVANSALAATYTLAGVPGVKLGDTLSLTAPIAALALPATVTYRAEFVQALWDAKLNTGTSRKFGDMLYLLSSLLLSGRFRVY